jgi:hypothetical protein
MTVRVLKLLMLMFTAHALSASPGDSLKVQLVMWNGAFAPDFNSIRVGNSERVLFRKQVNLNPGDIGLRPLALLKKHLDIPKLREDVSFYWRGAVCRPDADGKSVSLVFNEGALR